VARLGLDPFGSKISRHLFLEVLLLERFPQLTTLSMGFIGSMRWSLIQAVILSTLPLWTLFLALLATPDYQTKPPMFPSKPDLYSLKGFHVDKPVCDVGACSYDGFVQDFYPHSLDEAKDLMAKTLRILAALGLDEGVDGHLTRRVEDKWLPYHLANDDHLYFLVDRLGVGWSHIQAHQIVLIKEGLSEGKHHYEILDKHFRPTGRQDWRAAVWMNGGLHRARPDLKVILHTHSPYQRIHAATTRTLPMIDQNSMRFYGRIGYVPYPGIVVDQHKAEHLASHFKKKDILILRNHGAIFGTKTLQNALSLCYFLERVLTVTHSLPHDEPLHPIDHEVVEKTAKKLQGQAEELMAVLLFESLAKRYD
jgi:ribulose-5-phosphate 4-epimerase/fuculose-1-phosphate aldolase